MKLLIFAIPFTIFTIIAWILFLLSGSTTYDNSVVYILLILIAFITLSTIYSYGSED